MHTLFTQPLEIARGGLIGENIKSDASVDSRKLESMSNPNIPKEVPEITSSAEYFGTRKHWIDDTQRVNTKVEIGTVVLGRTTTSLINNNSKNGTATMIGSNIVSGMSSSASVRVPNEVNMHDMVMALVAAFLALPSHEIVKAMRSALKDTSIPLSCHVLEQMCTGSCSLSKHVAARHCDYNSRLSFNQQKLSKPRLSEGLP